MDCRVLEAKFPLKATIENESSKQSKLNFSSHLFPVIFHLFFYLDFFEYNSQFHLHIKNRAQRLLLSLKCRVKSKFPLLISFSHSSSKLIWVSFWYKTSTRLSSFVFFLIDRCGVSSLTHRTFRFYKTKICFTQKQYFISCEFTFLQSSISLFAHKLWAHNCLTFDRQSKKDRNWLFIVSQIFSLSFIFDFVLIVFFFCSQLLMFSP